MCPKSKSPIYNKYKQLTAWHKGPIKSKQVSQQVNIGEEHITFQVDEEQYNFDTFDACNADANDNQLIYYDWLADMATTFHITHQREAFIDYAPMENSSVTGVGSKEALISGHRTVELNSTCNGTEYILHLKNVFHVPGT